MAEVLYHTNGNPVTEENPLPVKMSGGGGSEGKSLEFNWDGTKLGVRVEGDEEYQYVDLKGKDGEDGDDGNDAEPQFTQEQVDALLALIEDDE